MSIASHNLMSFTAEATGRASRSQSYTDEFLSRLECDEIKASAGAHDDDDYSDEDDEDHPLDVEVADAMLAGIGGRRRKRRRSRRRASLTLARGPRLVRIGACLAVSAVVAIAAVAVFAGVRRLPGREQEAAAPAQAQGSGGGTSIQQDDEPTVPPPPPDLDVLCDVSNVETQDGYAECEEACRPADCCFWHGEGVNCRSAGTNGKICERYDSCVLALTAYNGKEGEEEGEDDDAAGWPLSLGPATNGPAGIEELCSAVRLADGDQQAASACRTECHKRACCFSSGVLNCSTQRSSWCAEYSACDRLQSTHVGGGQGGGGDDNDDDVADDDVGGESSTFDTEELVMELCSEDSERATPEGRAACHDVCLPGRCCFPEEDEGVQGCKGNREFCGPYSGCEGIFRYFASSSGHVREPDDAQDDDVHPIREPDAEDDDVHADDDVYPDLDPDAEDDDVYAENSANPDRDPEADDDVYDPESGNDGDGHSHANNPPDHEREPDADDDVYSAPRDPRDDDVDTASPELPVQVQIALACADSNVGTDAGMADCSRACGPGACCFPATRTMASSGRKDEEDDCSDDFCNAYAGCERYYRDHRGEGGAVEDHREDGNNGEEPSTNTTAAVRDRIAAKCSPTSLETGAGRSDCADACVAGSCCFPDPGELGDVDCSTRAGEFCLAYAGCGYYYREHGWKQQQRDDDVVAGDEGGDDDVVAGGATVRDQVALACSVGRLATEAGRADCARACEAGECCFPGSAAARRDCSGDTAAFSVDFCNQYAGCVRYYNDHSDDVVDEDDVEDDDVASGGGDGQAGQGGNVEVEEACASDKLRSALGLEECKMVCAERACCFEAKGGAFSCYAEMTEWCEEYEGPCVAMIRVVEGLGLGLGGSGGGADSGGSKGDSGEPAVAPEGSIASDEDDDVVEDDVVVVDDDGVEDDGVVVDDDVMKEAYVEDEAAEMESDEFEINLACTQDKLATAEGRSACEELCSERSCCFEEGHAGCYDVRSVWCEEYSACTELYVESTSGGDAYQDDEGTANDVPSTNVKTVCSPEHLKTAEGLVACTKLCSERSCCFTGDGPGSCRTDRRGWCSEYSACEGVYIGDTSNAMENEGTSGPGRDPAIASSTAAANEGAITLDEASDINVACSAESLNTSAGLILCTGLCNERACCFMRGTASCYGGKSEWCDEYKICDSVYIDGNT